MTTKAKLTLWFMNAEELVNFLQHYAIMQPCIVVEVYSAPTYKTVKIKDVTAFTCEESGEIRFNAGGKGFTVKAIATLRHEISFYEVDDD